MKVAPSFFREKAAERLLKRAATVTGVPLCLWAGDDLKIMGWGQCAACEYVNDVPEGKQACSQSRRIYVKLAREQGVPATFMCHLGFHCVAAPALLHTDYVIVLGPYIPADANRAVDFAVMQGLDRLEEEGFERDALPFDLDDIRVLSRDVVVEAAGWLQESLRELYEKDYEESGDSSESSVEEESTEKKAAISAAPRSVPKVQSANVEVSVVALSLLCGRLEESMALLDYRLYERKKRTSALAPLVLRTLSELLEAAGRMGGNVEDAWKAYSLFTRKANTLVEWTLLLRAAQKVLRKVAKHPEYNFTDTAVYIPVTGKKIFDDYASKNLLTLIAEETGVASSSITRMLEKMTGANFSEVLGRIRIAHARALLRETSLTNEGIAQEIGIKDQANFCKLFHRYCGCSPGVYRARHTKKYL